MIPVFLRLAAATAPLAPAPSTAAFPGADARLSPIRWPERLAPVPILRLPGGDGPWLPPGGGS